MTIHVDANDQVRVEVREAKEGYKVLVFDIDVDKFVGMRSFASRDEAMRYASLCLK